jgi:hypothetical protein
LLLNFTARIKKSNGLKLVNTTSFDKVLEVKVGLIKKVIPLITGVILL